MNSKRIGEKWKWRLSIKIRTVKKLADGAIRALLYIGLFGAISMATACARKAARQDAPHIAPVTPPAESRHSVLTTTTLMPSSSMCKGLTGDSETKCLCPNPLQFGINSLPESPQHNFLTDIDIKRSSRPMYRVRIFAADDLDSVGELVATPIDASSLNFIGRMDTDPASVILSSSTPKDEFKLNVETEKTLRLKCINQED